MFCDTIDVAHASATIYSLIITTKKNGIDLFSYLLDILTRIPRSEALEPLLTWNWKSSEAKPQLKTAYTIQNREASCVLWGAYRLLPDCSNNWKEADECLVCPPLPTEHTSVGIKCYEILISFSISSMYKMSYNLHIKTLFCKKFGITQFSGPRMKIGASIYYEEDL